MARLKWILAILLLNILPEQIYALSKDTIDLKTDTLTHYFKLSRDVEITLVSLTKFRCKLLYLDSKNCVVNYHTGVKPKNVVKGPEIADHIDSSLGKNIFVIPVSQIRMISFWKTRSAVLAELPLGLFSYTASLLTVMTLFTGMQPVMIAATGVSALGVVYGVFSKKTKRYVLVNSKLIRLYKKT